MQKFIIFIITIFCLGSICIDCFGQSKQGLTPEERAYFQKKQKRKEFKKAAKEEAIINLKAERAKNVKASNPKLDRNAATGFKRATKPVKSSVSQTKEQKVFDSLNQQLRYLKTISNPTQEQLTLIENIEEKIQQMIPVLEELDCNK